MKASDCVTFYKNENGPVIGTTRDRVIEKDGLYFKDLDGSKEYKEFDDWRVPAYRRASSYVKELSLEEKIGQLFVADWRMGKDTILDENEVKKGQNIFATQDLPGTTDALKNWFIRHLIIRTNPSPDKLCDWHNEMHSVAEDCKHLVPVQTVSNSRNEEGEMVFGMNDASGVFASWPGTLGIAAAIKGDSIDLIDDFADCVKREWNATGLRKGYMYMVDTMTDPRWQRTYGTFGEDTSLISQIAKHIIPRIQGSDKGVTSDGVAMTIKHFPGGGARENGFDPHYKMGQWNVYPTKNSLMSFHLPPFKVAADCNVSSIMPYYAKPAAHKSASQVSLEGNKVTMEPYGFAFNKYMLDVLLRKEIGFKGYVNSDSGVIHNMCWGVEMLDAPERIGFAVSHAGVDLISGSFDIMDALESYNRGKNDYYKTHKIPEGFNVEDITLNDESLDRAVTRTLTELFELGMFENPYRDPKEALEIVNNKEDWAKAYRVHQKSVVLLKNAGVLPLKTDKCVGKKVYIEGFKKNREEGDKETVKLRALARDYFELTEDYEEADIAILMISPSSGEYFNATPGYLELEICENKEVADVDEEGRPTAKRHLETTLSGLAKAIEIADKVHARGGKVISNINFTLAWEVGAIEKISDALLAGFSTKEEATLDVIAGKFSPVGKLPITLPKDDSVLAVNDKGVCISPNDVPGFKKDAYMPDSLKDENGKAYAYRDGVGNYYEMNFGLNY